MANNWGIPIEVEQAVRIRDKACVYCRTSFYDVPVSRKSKPTWEHIVNDVRINGSSNIALCCLSCNSSKGSKLLKDWLKSSYCQSKRISIDTVAEVVKKALKNPPTLSKV